MNRGSTSASEVAAPAQQALHLAMNPPSTPTLKEEKKSIEQREAERRRRVVRGNSVSQGGDPDEWWSLEKVESFYKECCASRDEPPSVEVSTAFKVID